jgi:hypothetical protein
MGCGLNADGPQDRSILGCCRVPDADRPYIVSTTSNLSSDFKMALTFDEGMGFTGNVSGNVSSGK